MGTDYNEILCTAIDTIVSAKIEGLQYDITKLCMIEDDSQRNSGKYIVSDGAVKFEAFSEDSTYRKGNNVQVVIPNNDYNMQKKIIGRVATTDTIPFKYTSPMDTMVKITSSSFSTTERISLLANENTDDKIRGTKKLVQIIHEPAKFSGFTRLGISADFQTWLFGQNVIEGTYGLQILLHLQNQNKVELIFSNKDMYGNPYNFESFFSQEKVFDISNYENIDKIEINFFQLADFTDGTSLISHTEEILAEDQEEVNNLPDNLFVDNIQIYLGYDITDFDEETLRLYCLDSKDFVYAEGMDRNIGLRWIHKISDDEFEILNESHFLNGEFEAIWYQYDKDYNQRDDYAGLNWREIFRTNAEDGNLSRLVTLRAENQKEEFKVVGIQKNTTDLINNGDISPEIIYVSNLLTFENKNYVPDKKSVEAATALQIVCEDGSEGNYFVYNQNGKIITPGTGQGFKRQFKALYKGAEINDSFAGHSIDYIKWWLPADKTMLKYSNDWYSRDQKYVVSGIQYYVVKKEPNKDTGKLDVYQPYSIGDQWYNSLSNNTIKCVLSIDGVEYEALEQLNFGKAGSNGSNLTLVLQFEDNQNALIVGENNTVTISAELYDTSGNNIGFVDSDKIAWSWFKPNGTNNYIELPTTENSSKITLKCKVDSVPINNYSILCCNLNDGQQISYLPIPLKASDYAHIEGATEVIYNHQGTPSYYSGPYVLYKLEDSEYVAQGCSWEIVCGGIDGLTGLAQSYIPTLKPIKNNDNKKGLCASTFYASGYNDEVCVYAEEDGLVLWSQPILIMQSQYDFSMLNQWDGQLTLDEGNGTIMSAMLGAGRKNENNTFSGVLIGDLKASGQDSTSAQTGVYGLHEGVMSYALKEDGTATFGKAGKGQIKIDGNNSTIYSGNYYTDSKTGMILNLDDGVLNVKVSDQNRITLKPTDPYFEIKSTDGNPLIHIGSKDYYLRNDGFIEKTEEGKEVNYGTKLDLVDGIFSTKNTSGSIQISSKDPFLSIQSSGGNQLMYLGSDKYYLQSTGYTGSLQVYGMDKGVKYLIFKYGENKYAVNNEKFYNYTGTTIDKDTGEITNFSLGSLINFETIAANSGTYKFDYVDDEGKQQSITKNYTANDIKKRYIANSTPYLTNTSPNGLHLNLVDGRIEGYDLMLRGVKAGDGAYKGKTIQIDSSSDTTPLTIGDKFKVKWDGSLICDNISYLGNKPDTGQYVINIADNFVVNASGGGSAPGMRVGYAGGAGTAGTAGHADTATRAYTAGIADQLGNYGPGSTKTFVTKIGSGTKSFTVTVTGGVLNTSYSGTVQYETGTVVGLNSLGGNS